MKNWTVYILLCSDKTLYTGITTNTQQRLKTHNKGKGAKYTRGRLPVKLVWSQDNRTQSQALKHEAKIKKYSKKQKLELINKK